MIEEGNTVSVPEPELDFQRKCSRAGKKAFSWETERKNSREELTCLLWNIHGAGSIKDSLAFLKEHDVIILQRT